MYYLDIIISVGAIAIEEKQFFTAFLLVGIGS